MSEETQQPEEQAENQTAPQAENTAETPQVEETTQEAEAEVAEAPVEQPAVEHVVLTERPALAEPGEFDWDAYDPTLMTTTRRIGPNLKRPTKTL